EKFEYTAKQLINTVNSFDRDICDNYGEYANAIAMYDETLADEIYNRNYTSFTASNLASDPEQPVQSKSWHEQPMSQQLKLTEQAQNMKRLANPLSNAGDEPKKRSLLKQIFVDLPVMIWDGLSSKEPPDPLLDIQPLPPDDTLPKVLPLPPPLPPDEPPQSSAKPAPAAPATLKKAAPRAKTPPLPAKTPPPDDTLQSSGGTAPAALAPAQQALPSLQPQPASPMINADDIEKKYHMVRGTVREQLLEKNEFPNYPEVGTQMDLVLFGDKLYESELKQEGESEDEWLQRITGKKNIFGKNDYFADIGRNYVDRIRAEGEVGIYGNFIGPLLEDTSSLGKTEKSEKIAHEMEGLTGESVMRRWGHAGLIAAHESFLPKPKPAAPPLAPGQSSIPKGVPLSNAGTANYREAVAPAGPKECEETSLDDLADILVSIEHRLTEIAAALDAGTGTAAGGANGLPALADELVRLVRESDCRERERRGWY
ncbi:MAG: hypothetical protein FWG06_00060, partial [Clostridiales bacterium]|nr:hypothetical protein [Clostridiales bacterium]